MHGTDGSVRHISASRTFVSLLSRIINKRSQFVNRTFKDFFGKRGFKGQVSAFCDTSRRFEKMSLTREKAGFLAKNLLKNIMSLHYNVCK